MKKKKKKEKKNKAPGYTFEIRIDHVINDYGALESTLVYSIEYAVVRVVPNRAFLPHVLVI